MEYSFSQTFGKGANMLQCSPTPSFHSSNKAASRSRSRSNEGHNDRSPVLESYPNRQQKIVGGHSNLADYIMKLSEQTRSYSQISKTKQQLFKESEKKLQAEIKNVDGLNQRMVNLINSLKKDYSLPKDARQKPDFLSSQKIQLINNTGMGRSSSTNVLKKGADIAPLRKQNLYQNSNQNKLGYKQNHKEGITKLKCKYQIEEKINKKQENKKNCRSQLQNSGKNQQDSLQKYGIKRQVQQMAFKLKQITNHMDLKGKKGGSWNQPVFTNGNTLKEIEKHRSVAIFKEKQNKQSNWLKGKVKTIESEMETNINKSLQNSIQEFQQFSYIEQPKQSKNPIQKIPQEQGESIYDQLIQKPVNHKKQKCEACGLHRPGKTETRKQYDTSNASTYRSIQFQNKLKMISDKIQNYQRKINGGASVATLKYNSKQSLGPKIMQRLEVNKSLPFSKKDKEKPNGQKIVSDPVRIQENYRCHQRKYTPTWVFEPPKDQELSTKFTSLMDSIETSKYRKQDKKEQAERMNLAINTFSLRQRMGQKLMISSSALKLLRQIQLDQEFRKAKKELSKLPEQIPGMAYTKWQLLYEELEKTLKKEPQIKPFILGHLKQKFQLTDQEADPFYSIAIQDLREYEQVINEAVSSFVAAQRYFNENILTKLIYEQVKSIFCTDTTQQNIRHDQFALLISNATKSNHKCRDVHLLFKRILSHVQVQQQKSIQCEEIGRRELMMVLIAEEQKKTTLRITTGKNQ